MIARSQQQRLTYDELNTKSTALASGLRQSGVKKGDRVAVSLGNTIEFATITYALSKLGAILVPLNPAFNASQVASALSHLDASHYVLGAENNLPHKPPKQNFALLKQIVPDFSSKTDRVHSPLAPSLEKVILVDNSAGRLDPTPFASTIPYEDLLTPATGFKAEDLDPSEIVNIQFTSGTTSAPKAACLTHRGILNNGFQIGERMGMTENDVVCVPPPLFHCFGSVLGYMATATHGSAILFPSEAFDPKATLLSIQEERATALYGVTTMFVAELELLANGIVPYTGFDKLRTGIAAGSSVPTALMQKLHSTLNLTDLTICYGMTETSPVSLMTRPTDPLPKRISSVGTLLPHVSAKIVDPEHRTRIVGIGEKGELAVSGYLVMKGYWGDEVRTKEVRVEDEKGEAWMFTGDEAVMDEDGFVSITGRIRDLIIRGGENIHPLEIENCLFAHPLIAEASVVGLPDEKLGECVAAFVTAHSSVQIDDEIIPSLGTRLTKDDVRQCVRESLSNHMVPKYVFWVNEYPKTTSGKIQKFKLREEGVKLVEEGMGI